MAGKVRCFYCNNLVTTSSPRHFICPHCTCTNRFSPSGEILGDEPAMHDEELNTRSFARRGAARSKDRLPTIYSNGSQGLFCRTCQTNQMLVANLLASYLPEQDDPEYVSRQASFPQYQASVEARYPPVCANCLPAIEEEIKRRDHMARTTALNGFLQVSRGKERERVGAQKLQRDGSIIGGGGKRKEVGRELTAWKVRGGLWWISLLSSLAANVAVVFSYPLPPQSRSMAFTFPLITLISIFWTAWDPTYASIRRARLQGRNVRQRGRQEYNILQVVAWLLRLVTAILLSLPHFVEKWDPLGTRTYRQQWESGQLPQYSIEAIWLARVCFILEIIIFVRSWFVLRIETPPPVRLQERFSARPSSVAPSRGGTPFSLPPTSHSAPASSITGPGEYPSDRLLASLSLNNAPILPPSGSSASGPNVNPVFGVASLNLPSTSSIDTSNLGLDEFEDEEDEEMKEADHDPNAMDWAPTTPARRAGAKEPARSSPLIKKAHHQNQQQTQLWMRPQRFFAPEEPTGLESLFAKTVRLADDGLDKVSPRADGGKGKRDWKRAVTFVVVSMALIGVFGLGARWWAVRRWKVVRPAWGASPIATDRRETVPGAGLQGGEL